MGTDLAARSGRRLRVAARQPWLFLIVLTAPACRCPGHPSEQRQPPRDASARPKAHRTAPDCAKLYQRYRECGTAALDEPSWMKACEQRRGEPRLKKSWACVTRSSCKAFRQCLRHTRRGSPSEAELKRQWLHLADERRAGRFTRALKLCREHRRQLPKDLAGPCKRLPAEAAEALLAQLRGARDQGRITHRQAPCGELRLVAREAGEDYPKRASLICEELELARRLRFLRKLAAAKTGAAPARLHDYCQPPHLKRIDRLGSKFGRALKTHYSKLCGRLRRQHPPK